MTVAGLYQQVRESQLDCEFTVAEVPAHEGIYIGADREGQPCLFVRAYEQSAQPALRTDHVFLQLSQEYELDTVDGSRVRQILHLLRCESSRSEDYETFLVLIGAFLRMYEGGTPTAENLTSFFHSLVRLFQVSPAGDRTREREGLWGELFVMSRARGFRFWAPFWHSEATRRFDFSSRDPDRRVEVKTTLGTQRIHHFSHRQIYAVGSEEILIGSILVREEDAGLSLRDLIQECRDVLAGTPHFFKLERAVRRAGMEDANETGPIFDGTEAEHNLAWFRSTDAPHFHMTEPSGVSGTRYMVDLVAAPRLSPDELEEWLDSGFLHQEELLAR